MTREDAQLPDLLLTVKDVAEIFSVTTRTIWRWSATNKIPRPVAPSSNVVRWRASEIQAHIDQLPKAS